MKCIGHAFFILLDGVCNTVFELQVCNFGHASFTRPKTVSTVPIHPVLGRFNAIGPMVDKYADWTPYNFAFNDPANKNDPGGDDPNIRYLGTPARETASGGWGSPSFFPPPNGQAWLMQQMAAGMAVGAQYQYLQDSNDWGLGAAQAAAADAIAQNNLQTMVNNALASPGGAGSYQHNDDGSWSKWNPYGGGDITEAQWVALGGNASTINRSAGASFSAGAWEQVSGASQGGQQPPMQKSSNGTLTYSDLGGFYVGGHGDDYILSKSAFDTFINTLNGHHLIPKNSGTPVPSVPGLYQVDVSSYGTEYGFMVGSVRLYYNKTGFVGFSDYFNFDQQKRSAPMAETATSLGRWLLPGTPFLILYGERPTDNNIPKR